VDVAAPVLLEGVAGIASGMLQALSDRLTTLSYLVLLTGSLLLVRVWLLWVSVLLLGRVEAR
jgi:hypothetical protein